VLGTGSCCGIESDARMKQGTNLGTVSGTETDNDPEIAPAHTYDILAALGSLGLANIIPLPTIAGWCNPNPIS